MNKYRFWSFYDPKRSLFYDDGRVERGAWLCIPPNKKYLPDWYPKNALIKKHNEEALPPPRYWYKPEHERLVYNQGVPVDN